MTQFLSIWVTIIVGALGILGFISTIVWRMAKLEGYIEALRENHKSLMGRLIANEEKQQEDTRISNTNFSRIFDKIETIYQILIHEHK